jgi:hypothetical protein
MTASLAPENLVADAIANLDTEEAKVEYARLVACYAFGAIAVFKGKRITAELAYSMGDALVEGK